MTEKDWVKKILSEEGIAKAVQAHGQKQKLKLVVTPDRRLYHAYQVRH